MKRKPIPSHDPGVENLEEIEPDYLYFVPCYERKIIK